MQLKINNLSVTEFEVEAKVGAELNKRTKYRRSKYLAFHIENTSSSGNLLVTSMSKKGKNEQISLK